MNEQNYQANHQQLWVSHSFPLIIIMAGIYQGFTCARHCSKLYLYADLCEAHRDPRSELGVIICPCFTDGKTESQRSSVICSTCPYARI